MIAALQEKDEDHGKESSSITLARCHKNSEKIMKIVKRRRSKTPFRTAEPLAKLPDGVATQEPRRKTERKEKT